MKRSKRERKFVNSMRSMAEVPTPARLFKYPPTFGNRRLRGAITPRVRVREQRRVERYAQAFQQHNAAQQRLHELQQQRAQREQRGLFRRSVDRIFSRRKV